MMLLVEVASWALILLGSFFTIVGALGLVRMPEVFTRMHAASVTDTLGVGFLILGMCCASALIECSRSLSGGLKRYHGSGGVLARTWATGSMAFWATLMLAVYLILTLL